MSQRFRYLFKNLGILTISNFSSKILVFLLVPLYTSILSTEEYGLYDLSISTVQLLYPILTINIVDAVMRFTMDKDYPNDEVAFIGLKHVARSFVIAVAATVVISCFGLIPSFSGLEYLVLLYYLSYVANQYFIQLAKGLEKVGAMAVGGIMGTVVMVAGNLLFLLVFGWGLKGFYLANILAQAVPVVFYFFKLRFVRIIRQPVAKTVRRVPVDRKKMQRDMILYCGPLIFTTLGWWANNTADKYVVSIMLGVAANGILSVAYKIPQILNVVQGIFTQAWQISAVKEYGEDDTARFYGRTFYMVNFAICVCCTLLLLGNKLIAGFLYAKDFYVAWRYVPFLLVSSVLNTASGFLGPILGAKKDSNSMAKSAIIGTVANIAMNIVLVHFIGIQGAVIATAISSFVIYYVRLRAVKGLIEFKSYWKVLLTWVLLCGQAVMAVSDIFILYQLIIVGVLLALYAGDIRKFFEKGRSQMRAMFGKIHKGGAVLDRYINPFPGTFCEGGVLA